MTEVLKLVGEFGVPVTILLWMVFLLWQENRKLRRKIGELYERIVALTRANRPGDPRVMEELNCLLSKTARLREDLDRLLTDKQRGRTTGEQGKSEVRAQKVEVGTRKIAAPAGAGSQ